MEKDRAFKFLAGLNVDIDDVHGRFVGKEPLPIVREVFLEV